MVLVSSKTAKERKLYYSIGEVAELLKVSETLLRYWETEFPSHINPRKAGRKIRQYTQEDIQQLRIIHHLLKEKGYRIAAARTLLQKNKEGVERNFTVITHLQEIKNELLTLKKQLEL